MSSTTSPFQSLLYTHGNGSPYTLSTPSSSQDNPEEYTSPPMNPTQAYFANLPTNTTSNDCFAYQNLQTPIWSAGSMDTIPLTPYTGMDHSMPILTEHLMSVPPPLTLGVNAAPALYTSLVTPLPSGLQMLPPAPPNTASIPCSQTQLTPAFSTLFQPNLFESPTQTPTSGAYIPTYPNDFQTTANFTRYSHTASPERGYSATQPLNQIYSNSNTANQPFSPTTHSNLTFSPINPTSGPLRTHSHSHTFSHPPNARSRSSTLTTPSTGSGFVTPVTPLTAFSPIGGYGNSNIGHPYPSPRTGGLSRMGSSTNLSGGGVGSSMGGGGKRVFHPGPSPSFGSARSMDVFTEDGEADSSGIGVGNDHLEGVFGEGTVSYRGGTIVYGSTSGGVGLGMGLGLDGKSPRFRPTKEQLEILVESYNKNPNPDAHERDILLKRMGGEVKAKTLQIWFQNRRSKSRARERDSQLPSKLHLRGRLSLGGRGSLGGKIGVDLDAIRGLIRDEDPNLMIVPLNVLRISGWTRFLTPGLGYTTPDLACTLHIPLPGSYTLTPMTPALNSTTPALNPTTPTLNLYINHNNQTFRLIIPISPSIISDLKTQTVGEAFALGFTLMGGGVEFESWDEGWKEVGDFTGGIVKRGGECELTGEKESLLPVYERITAIFGASPTYPINQGIQVPPPLFLDQNRHRSSSAPQSLTPCHSHPDAMSPQEIFISPMNMQQCAGFADEFVGV